MKGLTSRASLHTASSHGRRQKGKGTRGNGRGSNPLYNKSSLRITNLLPNNMINPNMGADPS
jgi:hypothetical protein